MFKNTKKAVISNEEILALILKGIKNAKGSNDAIRFLSEEDLLKLGEELANREALTKNLFSIVVDPINDIEEGKRVGHYDSIYPHINSITVPLQKAQGSKRIYFVPVNEKVEEGEEDEFLKKFGKRPVVNALNYLLGTMAKLKEEDLPDHLKLKDFVAVSSDEKEVFYDHNSLPCFLYCDRSDGGRELSMVFLGGGWSPEYDWFFLAEDIL